MLLGYISAVLHTIAQCLKSVNYLCLVVLLYIQVKDC